MVLRAVNDPTNGMHLVAALRTPLLGCGDDDLFRFKIERGGHWTIIGDQPDTVPADDPVGTGIAYLRSLYEDRVWCSPSELLDRIARDRRALELGFGEGRPRDVWRRLRFVIDQARAWSDATAGSLREYVHWVEMQSAEGSRVAEAILPETDDDAVRIMTIHAAKGLEFPITIVSGMSTKPGGRYAPADVAFPPSGRVAYRFGRHVETEEWSEWKPVDEQMGFDERIRLLYVACTRACDHLVVSLHRAERKKEPGANARTNAELLIDGMRELLDDIPDAVIDRKDAIDAARAGGAGADRGIGRVGRRAGGGVGARNPADFRCRDRAHRRGCARPGVRAHRGPAEAPARPRPASVVERPVRHGGRSCGARRAADHRSRDRRRARRRRRGAVRSGSDPRPGRPGTPTCRRRAPLTVGRRGRPQRTLARGVRLHARQRTAAGGLHRPPVSRAATASSSSTTRRAQPTTPSSSTAASRAIASRAPATRSRSRRRLTSPSAASRSCSSRRMAPSNAI